MTAAVTANPTRQYLELLAQVNGMSNAKISPAAWLLKHGIERERGPLPKGVRRGAMRACYWNSLELAEKGKGRYVYMEGYATALIPVEHAWCYDRETGLVVDRTWNWGDRGEAYLGVPIQVKYARYCLKRNRSALMDWTADYPIITGEVLESAWKEQL